jgi:hypothetical protein
MGQAESGDQKDLFDKKDWLNDPLPEAGSVLEDFGNSWYQQQEPQGFPEGFLAQAYQENKALLESYQEDWEKGEEMDPSSGVQFKPDSHQPQASQSNQQKLPQEQTPPLTKSNEPFEYSYSVATVVLEVMVMLMLITWCLCFMTGRADLTHLGLILAIAFFTLLGAIYPKSFKGYSVMVYEYVQSRLMRFWLWIVCLHLHEDDQSKFWDYHAQQATIAKKVCRFQQETELRRHLRTCQVERSAKWVKDKIASRWATQQAHMETGSFPIGAHIQDEVLKLETPILSVYDDPHSGSKIVSDCLVEDHFASRFHLDTGAEISCISVGLYHRLKTLGRL